MELREEILKRIDTYVRANSTDKTLVAVTSYVEDYDTGGGCCCSYDEVDNQVYIRYSRGYTAAGNRRKDGSFYYYGTLGDLLDEIL